MKKALLAIVSLFIPTVLTTTAICMVNTTWFTIVGVLLFALMTAQTYSRMTNKEELKTKYRFALAFKWNATVTATLCILASAPYVEIPGIKEYLFAYLGAFYFFTVDTVNRYIFPNIEEILKEKSKEDQEAE